jgi:hypothetical protein
MTLAARIDDYGKPAWSAAVILALIIWWPLGVALVAYLFWSRRMGCWNRKDVDHWRGKGERWMRSRGQGFGFSSSGNRAFDDYKAETLRRLEDEQQEFFEFLDRLRKSKDQAEFDQFMADRARRTPPAATDTAA